METIQTNAANSTIIDLKNVCRYFDPYKNKHQLDAVNWLERQFGFATLREFYQRWENKTITSDPALKLNSSGAAVVELQKLLNRRSANLVVDGQFGAKTQAAVKQFQLNQGLTSDGVVGSVTWQRLREVADPHALRTTFYSYKPTENPSQNPAIDWLQNRISQPTLTEFARRWRTPSA